MESIFCIGKKGHAESAFREACSTSSGYFTSVVVWPILHGRVEKVARLKSCSQPLSLGNESGQMQERWREGERVGGRGRGWAGEGGREGGRVGGGEDGWEGERVGGGEGGRGRGWREGKSGWEGERVGGRGWMGGGEGGRERVDGRGRGWVGEGGREGERVSKRGWTGGREGGRGRGWT